MKSKEELFWAKVTKTETCWIHGGSLGSHGYPQATEPDKRQSGPAHRVYWKLFIGQIPPGLMVLHRCNNKLCVNPDHLRLGTHGDNMQDVADTQTHSRRKLTQEQAREIRTSTESSAALERRYAVTGVVISNIRKGATYRELGQPGAAHRKCRPMGRRGLSVELVSAIREHVGTYAETSAAFDVSTKTVRNIKRGQTHKV